LSMTPLEGSGERKRYPRLICMSSGRSCTCKDPAVVKS